MEIWREKGDVDGNDDVVEDDNKLVVEEGVGAGSLDMNEGEERQRLFREF